MNVRNPDIANPYRHPKTGAGYSLHANISRTCHPPCANRIGRLIETEPEKLANMSHIEIMKNAGAEAVELIMWLVMRGAMAPAVKKTHVNYYAPMTTGMGLIAIVDL